MTEYFTSSLIILPLFLALISAFSYNRTLRYVLAYLTLTSLTVMSVLTFIRAQGVIITLDYPSQVGLIITTLDMLLLLYFLYVGIKKRHVLVVILAFLQIIPLIHLETVIHEVRASPTFLIDPLSATMCLIICIIGSLIVVYSLSYMEEHEKHLHLQKTRQPRFLFFMILFLAAMNGVVISNNLYWLYFFWEVTTFCCYQLIRHDLTEQSEKNALLALWVGLIGGVAFIGSMYLGVYYVYSLSIAEILRAKASVYIPLTLALLSLAAFTKSAQIPFQSWLLGAMIAPTPVSALLHSSTMVKAGVYLILRMTPAMSNFPALSYCIAAVGGLSFLSASVLAINQRESKKVLAYSTISNLGLIILCAGINTPLALMAAMFLLIFHAISKGLLFLGAGVIENRVLTRNIEHWEGMLGKYPLSAMVMLLGMVMMYLPPFGMLIGKWLTIESASSLKAISIPLVLILSIGGATTTFFWSKWMGCMLTHPPALFELKPEKIPFSYKLSMLTMVGIDVALSIFAGLVAAIIDPALKVLRGEAPVPYSLLGIFTDMGSFLTIPLILSFFVAIVLALVIARLRGGSMAPPYLCGENVSGDPYSFISTVDKPVKFDVSNLYFDRSLGSPSVNKTLTLIGMILLAFMFSLVVI